MCHDDLGTVCDSSGESQLSALCRRWRLCHLLSDYDGRLLALARGESILDHDWNEVWGPNLVDLVWTVGSFDLYRKC